MTSIGMLIAFGIIFANAFGNDFLFTCPTGELLCGDRKKCVATFQVCNYVQDCQDFSDETNLGLCEMLKKRNTKCDPGMIACDNFTVAVSTESNTYTNNNEDNYEYNYYGRRVIKTTTTTTTTEAPKHSRYPFLSSQCLDLITACVIGKDCLGDDRDSICQEISGGKLSSPGTKIFSTSTDIDDMYTLLKEISDGLEDISNATCPYFHTHYKGKCIWELPIKTTWYEAKKICESIGSKLAILNDFDSIELIRSYINPGRSNFWIGGSYMTEKYTSSGTWKWINGSEMTNDLIFWARKSSSILLDANNKIEPRSSNQVSDGKCVAILSDNYYLFSDEDCSLRFSPLCVKEADVKAFEVGKTIPDNVEEIEELSEEYEEYDEK